MTEGQEDDKQDAEDDGPFAGWQLTQKQKSFLHSLLPDNPAEEPEITPPPDEP